MSKTNKELAIDVAIAVITSNPRTSYGPNNANLTPVLGTDSICNIIKAVNSTLNDIDSKNKN